MVLNAPWQQAPTYRDVLVPVRVIERQEPDTVIRWRDRIVERIVQPTTTATAPGAATGAVERFCEADTVWVADTVVVEREPMVLLRSGSFEDRRFFRAGKLTLTGVQNTGDLTQWTYDVRTPASWRANADSLIVRSARWGIFGDLMEAGVWMGTGYLLGRIR